MLQEQELSRWELESIVPGDAFAAIRTEAPLMLWTPIEELGALMLNLFSPRDHLLWNLRDYRAFQAGNVAYVDGLVRDENSRRLLDDVITESGAERQSDFAYLLLGGLARRYGDRYFPVDTSALSQSAGRHLSIIVPAAQRAAVGRYFQRQYEVFGESAFHRCPDGIGVGLSDDRYTVAFRVLQVPADGLRMRDRQGLVAAIESIRAGELPLWQHGDEHWPYGYQAGVLLMLLSPATDAVDDIASILRFRAEVAVREFSLPVLERVKQELEDSGWNHFALADLREELRGMFDAQLSKYPVIQTNPFAG